MMFQRLRADSKFAYLAAALLLAPGGAALAHEADNAPAERSRLALMGTIPIYWGEVDDGFDALVTGAVEPHWARAQLEEEFQLSPLDYLAPASLADIPMLLMAQPRGLTPEENVVLDEWVRAGGLLLLFADPAMTGHSHYGLGDRRRPQDTALLSPILAHWGLALQFDVAQPEGFQRRDNGGGYFPVNLPGELVLAGASPPCTLSSEGLVATCPIGVGYAVIVADAAMLDHAGPWPGAVEALADLVAYLDILHTRGGLPHGPAFSIQESIDKTNL